MPGNPGVLLQLGVMRGSLGKRNVCDEREERRLYLKENGSSERRMGGHGKKGLCVNRNFLPEIHGNEDDEPGIKSRPDRTHRFVDGLFFFPSITSLAASQTIIHKHKALEKELIL